VARHRLLLFIAIPGVILAMIFWGYQRFSAIPTVEKTMVSSHYPVDNLLLSSASGYAVPSRKASLSSKVTGRLAWLGVREGSRVLKGELVARLDGDEYQAALEQAVANLDLLQSRLAQAEATMDENVVALRRTKELHRSGFLSNSALDSANTRASISEAGVKVAQAEIRVAKAALRNAHVMMENTKILAPFDGVIIALNANVGDIVTPFSASLEAKGAVLTIADPQSLEIRVEIGESQLARVHTGQPCLIRIDAFPNIRLPSSVSRIVPLVDRAKGTVQLLAGFDAAKLPDILPDMSAKVDFLERAPSPEDLVPVTVVDQEALAATASSSAVYRIVNSQLHLTPVKTGRHFGRLVEILDGLRPGDVVVMRPPPRLTDKAAVHIKP
jgi:RND family efflux transporter MFP subunit